MLEKFSQASAIFGAHIRAIAALVLVFWIPANIILYSITPKEGDAMGGFIAINMLFAIVGMLITASLYLLLWRVKTDTPYSVLEIVQMGTTRWMSLILVNMLAGLVITLGLLALILPGIYLSLCFALVGPIIVIERSALIDTLKRSNTLTKGYRWEILAATLLFVLSVLLGMLFVELLFRMLGLQESAIAMLVIDCSIQLAAAYFQTVIFLYYWESAQKSAAEVSATTESLQESTHRLDA